MLLGTDKSLLKIYLEGWRLATQLCPDGSRKNYTVIVVFN